MKQGRLAGSSTGQGRGLGLYVRCCSAIAHRFALPGLLIASLALVLYAQAAGPIVVLVGFPGSGRPEQAAILKSERGWTTISADDLIARNPQAFEQARKSAIRNYNPRLDPAMNGLVEAAMRSTDLSKGLVLVGYPASNEQGNFLVSLRKKLNLPKALVIRLVVPDDVVRKQLEKEKVADIEQELKNYHRELDFVRTYFPESDIRDVDGNRSADKVANDIRQLLPK